MWIYFTRVHIYVKHSNSEESELNVQTIFAKTQWLNLYIRHPIRRHTHENLSVDMARRWRYRVVTRVCVLSQNLTAYYDLRLNKCYIIQLNTSIVMPPRDLRELLANFKVTLVRGRPGPPGASEQQQFQKEHPAELFPPCRTNVSLSLCPCPQAGTYLPQSYLVHEEMVVTERLQHVNRLGQHIHNLCRGKDTFKLQRRDHILGTLFPWRQVPAPEPHPPHPFTLSATHSSQHILLAPPVPHPSFASCLPALWQLVASCCWPVSDSSSSLCSSSGMQKREALSCHRIRHFESGFVVETQICEL